MFLVQRATRFLQGALEEGTRLRIQSAADDVRPIVVGPHPEMPPLVPLPLRLRLGRPVHPPPRPHYGLHLGRGPVPRQLEQLRLGPRRGDARESADLGVGELAPLHRLTDPRQIAKGAGDADLLAGGAGGDPGAPAQPMGAAQEAAVPAVLLLEVAQADEEAVGAGVEIGGEGSDLLAELLQLVVGREYER